MIGSLHTIERKHLFDLLAQGNLRRALITGQPAQGKSTLLADCIGYHKPASLWFNLTASQDSVPELRIQPDRCSLAINKIRDNRWQHRLLRIASRVPGPLWIVIDRLDLLKDGSDRCPLTSHLIRIIEKLPDNCRLFLAGRFLPATVRKRVEQSPLLDLIIKNRQLSFSRQEIKCFFLQSSKLSLTPAETRNILAITRGWPGALQPAAELLSLIPAIERRRYIEARLESDLSKSLESYFDQQVLEPLSRRKQNLLVELAVFETIDQQILQAAGWSPSQTAVVEDFHTANLFLNRHYIPDRGWSYKLHPLFRRYLLRRFRKTRGSDDFCRASLEVARACRRLNRPLDAVGSLLEAGRTEKAAGIMAKTGIDLVVTDQQERLRGWMQLLPKHCLQQDPWLQWLQAVCQPVPGVQNVQRFNQLRIKFADLADPRGQLLATARLLETAIFVSYDRKQLAAWTAQGRFLLDSLAGQPYFTWAKAWLWLQIGLAQVYTGIDLQQGISACRNASLLAVRIRDDKLRAIADSIIALGLTLNGNLDKAGHALERAGYIDPESGKNAYGLLQEIIRLEFALHRGDWPLARQIQKNLETQIEDSGLLFLYPALLDATARLSLYRGDTAAADQWRRHLSDAAILTANPYFTAMANRLGALVQYYQGRFDQASNFIEKALETLEVEGLDTLPYWQTRLIAGLINLHLKRFNLAHNHIYAAGHFFNQAACISAKAENCLAYALIDQARGNTLPAEASLHSGCQLIAAGHHTHFTCLSPTDLVELGRWAITTDRAATIGCGHQWLQRYQPLASKIDNVQDHRQAASGPNIRVFDTRSWKQIPEQLQIFTFGRFSVCNSKGQPIERPRLVGGRPSQLLKALIVLGVREVPRDQLLETLWPEADPTISSQAFKVALHRLRKAMEPSLAKGRASAYLHLKNKRLSLDHNLCWIDCEAFLKLDKDIRRNREALDRQNLLDLCRQATTLYQGPFLPQERYSAWTEIKRMALAEAFCRIQLTMAMILEAEGQAAQAVGCYNRILSQDPISVDACQGLMKVYAALGHFGHLRDVYRNHCRALATQIGEEPDSETKQIYLSLIRGR